MLSKELNEKLTQVGPGTSMGKLLRYYWYPIAGVAELDVSPPPGEILRFAQRL